MGEFLQWNLVFSSPVLTSLDFAELKDSIETFTTQQVSNVAADTARLRSELEGVILEISEKIAADRVILGNLQYQADVVQSHLGDTVTGLGTLRDYVLRVEQEVARVRDTGISAVRTVHDELIALRRHPPVDLDNPPMDQQLRGDHNRLRTDFDSTIQSLRSELLALATDVYGKLQMTENAVTQRLDASDQRSQALYDRQSLSD